MRIPGATYRVQLHAGFGFADALELVPYLDSLGVTDLYASPVLAARPGSPHGYDVVDPTRLNPELGTVEEFESLAAGLRRRGMGLLLDIVPNHMAMSHENPWWMDVLRHGPASGFAGFFDIDWQAPGLEGKVLVPVLGKPYAEALDAGDLRLVLDDGALVVRYHEHRFPIDPGTYGMVVGDGIDTLAERLGPSHQAVLALRALLRLADRIPPRRHTGPRSVERRAREAEAVTEWIREIRESSPEARAHIDQRLNAWGGDPRPEPNRERLDRLIAEQAYVLSFWRAAAHEMGYRRFFDISELVSMRSEDPAVFEAMHGLLIELVRRGDVTGLRIDHIDGLRDPGAYLERLRDRSGAAYAVVEKILAAGESLREEWPVAGTTGYDFLAVVGDLLIDDRGVATLAAAYSSMSGLDRSFDQVAVESKRLVMEQLFQSEVGALAGRLQRLARKDRRGRDLTAAALAAVLVEVTAHLSVYRTYVRAFEVAAPDRHWIDRAVSDARSHLEAASQVPADASADLDFLRRVLLLDVRPRPGAEGRPPAKAHQWLEFVMRWQQFAGPAMAKGVEDTAMYVHHPLLSRNDVGTDPGSGPVTRREFDARMRSRARRLPRTLNATSTHDTKRSEDVRARIGVLSTLAVEWVAAVSRWSRVNAGHKQEVGGVQAPDPNEEWSIYQTLAGAWPLDRSGEGDFAERMAGYVRKALREAKVHSSWIRPDEPYEAAVEEFVLRVMRDRAWRRDFLPLQRRVAFHGALAGLAQTVLKIAAPGVPDLYQGTELWDLSLVDPDNRRPVDFALRRRLLADLDHRAGDDLDGLLDELVDSWHDGRLKLFVIARSLRFRRDHSEPFRRGTFVPLAARGGRADHVHAFARHRGAAWAVVAVARLTAGLGDELPVGDAVWDGTYVSLPATGPQRWTNAITGERLESSDGRLPLAHVFARLPVALLGVGGPGD